MKDARETAECNQKPCPIDCRGGWSPWSECTQPCGVGVQRRQFQVLAEPQRGGEACDHVAGESEHRMCNKDPCPVDCVGNFSAWSGKCPECGAGQPVVRTFEVARREAHGGRACDFEDGYTQREMCQMKACRSDCEGTFGKWSPCSRHCGGGVRRRRFTVVAEAQGGGAPCALGNGEVEAGECNTQPCPVPCEGEWTAAGTCSKRCGGGEQLERFTVRREAAHGGKACRDEEDSQRTAPCNTQACDA